MNDKAICKMFEKEMFLYIDKDLPDDKISFWKEHLANCNSCRSLLNDTEIIVGSVKENYFEDLLDVKYETMIEKVVQSKRSNFLEWFFPSGSVREKYAFSFKLAVVGVLAVIAVIISLSTNQPNTVKTISRDLLDWDGEKITTQINELKNKMNLIQDSNWDKQIDVLDQRMKNLEKESDKFSFN